MKRSIQVLIFALLMPLAFSSVAQIEKFVSGTHYTELKAPVNTRDSSKVEVLEAFWYGCSHCFRFEPLIENWHANAPADVDFARFPAMWNALMEIHAQVYYAAEALDALSQVHDPVFNAINIEGNRLRDYEIRSTPNMIVNGKYLVATGENVRTQTEMLEIVDFLVEKERRLLSSSGE